MTLKHIVNFDSHYLELLGVQLNELNKIQEHLPLIKNRLIEIYKDKFPKKCNCCGNIYHGREEYLAGTNPMKTPNKSTFIEYDKVLEFRNCKCDSTLLIMFESRRDQSEFGLKRRNIFKECVTTLLQNSHLSHDQASYIVRTIFRSIEDQFASHIIKDFASAY